MKLGNNIPGSRFSPLINPLYQIDLKRLERETRKFLYLGIMIGVLFHAGLLFLYPSGKTKIADEKNMQVELVKVQPEISRPVIIPPRITRQISIPKSTTRDIYRFKRKSLASVPFAGKRLQNPFSLDNSDMREQIIVPEHSLTKKTETLHDSILAQEIIFRMPKDIIPFSSDLFVDKRDNQSSKSMVIIPPGNKMAIQGYTHIASIYGEEFAPQDTLIHAFEVLADAVKFYTNIDAECDSRIKLSSTIYKYPLIYLCYDKPFVLTEDERKLLAGYISTGGFIIIDNPLPEVDGGRVGNSLKNAFTYSFYKVGVVSYSEYIPLREKKYTKKFKEKGILPSRTIKPLPKNHELFHCFFDFNDDASVRGSNNKSNIEGMYLAERLIGFYTTGLGLSWNDKRNEEQLKMGVNMLVYALKHGQARYNYSTGEMVRVDKFNPVKIWGDTLRHDTWVDIEETIR